MLDRRVISSVLFVTILWSILCLQSTTLADQRYDDDAFYLLLLGKSGHGKSALGNHILGREVFESRLSPNSVTKHCQKEQGQIGNQHVVVVDTPGTMDTEMDPEKFLKHFSKAAALTPHGYHVILLVFSSVIRVTTEEKEAIQILEGLLGDGFFEHVIFVFTFANVFAANIDNSKDISEAFRNYLKNLDSEMKTFIAKAGRRCMLMDATDKEGQVRKDTNMKLLGMVEDLVTENEGHKYFNIVRKMEEQKQKIKREEGKNMKGRNAQTAEEREWEVKMREREIAMEKDMEQMREKVREMEWAREKEKMKEAERVREWEREKERMRIKAKEMQWESERKLMMLQDEIYERERKRQERAPLRLHTGIVPLDSLVNYIFDGLNWLYGKIFRGRKLIA